MTKLVAELGINHNGNEELLYGMADTFLETADYVKLQMRTPELCVPRSEWNKPKEWNGKTMTYLEYKKLIELSPSQYDAFNENYKLFWSCSVWDMESLTRASKYPLPFIKIPSAKLTDLNLIHAAGKRFPLVMSTGMSTVIEIEAAVLTARKVNSDITLLHCTSTYPTVDSEINLSGMDALREWFPDVKIGFSSHSKSPFPAVYSMFYGAKFIEVHATLDRTLPGTDQSASLEPSGFELLRREIDRIPTLIGDGIIRVYNSELEPMKKLRG